jgi:hypothetical protein
MKPAAAAGAAAMLGASPAFADEIGDAAKNWVRLLTALRRRLIGTMACIFRHQVPSSLLKL